MKRRIFMLAILGAVSCRSKAGAQSAAARPSVVGILHPGSPPDAATWLDGLRDGLKDLGYVDGRNVRFEYRWGERKGAERLEQLAQELVDLKVDVIVIIAGPAVIAARRRTSTIPIVMSVSGDPLGTGVVSSLARPGANVTGLSLMSGDLAGLRLALLKEAVPSARRIGVLYHPGEPPTVSEMRETEEAARKLGLDLVKLETRSGDDLEPAFARAVSEQVDGLITFAHAFAFVFRNRITELAAKHRLPAMYGWREYAEVGGLMAYGPNVKDTLRRAAYYVDRILKGAKPGDLPIEQPTKFELVINGRTANTLGIELPASLRLRAAEVIE
jgi:putative ABC transport system substrate-binding protein